MQREIKFRAWDDNGKESRMYYPGDRTSDGSCLMLNMHGDVLEARKLHRGEVNHTPGEAYNHAVYPARIGHSLTLMQYTGLKDKNGVEIYEGDIITNHGVTNDMKQRIFKILWVDDGARFRARDEAADMNTALLAYDAKRCEVLGNIYENPELLGANQ